MFFQSRGFGGVLGPALDCQSESDILISRWGLEGGAC